MGLRLAAYLLLFAASPSGTLSGTVAGALAGSSAGPTAGPTAAQQTANERLLQLRDEVAAQSVALDRLRAASRAEIEALQATRRELATELLGLALAEERARSPRKELTLEVARAERELARRLVELSSIQGATQGALERLSIAASSVPGLRSVVEDSRRDALAIAKVRMELPDGAALLDSPGSEAGDFPELGDGILRRTLSAYAKALTGATTLEVSETVLNTAGGTEEQVQLLSVGWIAFAYRKLGGATGLALASPVDASGYRWSEEFDEETSSLISSAIDSASAGESIVLPVDPTGSLRPGSVNTRQTLRERIFEGGPLMIPLALVALAAALIALERVFTLFFRNRRTHDLAYRVLEHAEQRQLEQATQLCDSSTGIISRTLGACLERGAQGKEAMEDAIQDQLFQELPTTTRFIRTMAILAAVAPLIGLLGTVTGIIQTFGVIKVLGSTDPTQMAGGISVALITTAAGLSVAIPTMLVQGLLRGRGDRLIADAERYAASLLTILVHGQAQSGREA